MSKATVFPQPYPSAACDIFSCQNRAKWFIGRLDGPMNLNLKVCDSCLEGIKESLGVSTPEPTPEPVQEPVMEPAVVELEPAVQPKKVPKGGRRTK